MLAHAYAHACARTHTHGYTLGAGFLIPWPCAKASWARGVHLTRATKDVALGVGYSAEPETLSSKPETLNPSRATKGVSKGVDRFAALKIRRRAERSQCRSKHWTKRLLQAVICGLCSIVMAHVHT